MPIGTAFPMLAILTRLRKQEFDRKALSQSLFIWAEVQSLGCHQMKILRDKLMLGKA